MLKKYFVFLILAVLIFINLPKAVSAESAILYFSPSGGTFAQGESFWIDIMVNTKGEKVNAVAAYLNYTQDKLESLGMNTAGSIMTIWAEKSAAGGKIKISGGLPTPGFSGIKKIASIGFKAKSASGSVNLKFSSDSAVLTDVGNKNILSLAASGWGTYTFKAQSATPVPESQPLAILNLKVVEITRNSAIVSWQTDQDSDSVVDYGITTDYLLSTSSSQLIKDHSLTVSGLLPGNLYYFKAKSQTASGVRAETQYSTFATLGYLTEIQILDPETKEPLSGVEVTAGGTDPQTKITNDEGKVFFENLSAGRQKILMEYKDNSYTYQIKVTGENEPQSFQIVFDRQLISINLATAIIFSVVFLALAILILLKLFKSGSHWEGENSGQI
jgi:hypothetical protein